MNELPDWIDKNVIDLSATQLYQHLFNAAELNNEEENVFYISSYENGIELVLSKYKVVESIHLFGIESNIKKRFKGDLPFGVDFYFSRQKVHNLFGVPKRSGGGHRNLLLGFINLWDKYYFSNYSLRFEYSPDEQKIVLVTIASLALESNFDVRLQ